MQNELTAFIRRYAMLYDRGVITGHEFVYRILDLFINTEASSGEIKAAFPDIPDTLTLTLKTELHQYAGCDFYRRSFAMEDTRTDLQVHADALARQAPLRRVCGILMPLVLDREIRIATTIPPNDDTANRDGEVGQY